MVGFLGSATAKLRLFYVNRAFIYQYLIVLLLQLGRALVLPHLFSKVKSLFVSICIAYRQNYFLFFFTDDAVFLALSGVMLP